MAPARPTVRYQPMDCARGHADNERTAHQRSLPSERPSWHRFEATPLRLCMHAAASGFLDPLRRAGCKTAPGACATMATRQLHGRTLGARVPAVTDRITIAFPRIVSGGTALETPCDLLRLWASALAGPVRAMESPRGSRATRGREAQAG